MGRSVSVYLSHRGRFEQVGASHQTSGAGLASGAWDKTARLIAAALFASHSRLISTAAFITQSNARRGGTACLLASRCAVFLRCRLYQEPRSQKLIALFLLRLISALVAASGSLSRRCGRLYLRRLNTRRVYAQARRVVRCCVKSRAINILTHMAASPRFLRLLSDLRRLADAARFRAPYSSRAAGAYLAMPVSAYRKNIKRIGYQVAAAAHAAVVASHRRKPARHLHSKPAQQTSASRRLVSGGGVNCSLTVSRKRCGVADVTSCIAAGSWAGGCGSFALGGHVGNGMFYAGVYTCRDNRRRAYRLRPSQQMCTPAAPLVLSPACAHCSGVRRHAPYAPAHSHQHLRHAASAACRMPPRVKRLVVCLSWRVSGTAQRLL